jgi:hypothetical protein
MRGSCMALLTSIRSIRRRSRILPRPDSLSARNEGISRLRPRSGHLWACDGLPEVVGLNGRLVRARNASGAQWVAPHGRRTVKTEHLPGSLVTITSPPIMRASLREFRRSGCSQGIRRWRQQNRKPGRRALALSCGLWGALQHQLRHTTG